jgi:hypothetical protein
MDAANRWLANPGQQDPDLYNAGRTIGTYAAPVALAPFLPAAPAGVLGRIGYGAATGGALGAATPVDNPDENYWGQKAAQTGTGMAIGGAVPAAGAAGRALLPGPSPAIQTLRGAGVEPTPGAAAGGLPAIAEDLWSRIPVLGAPVQAGRRAAQEQFTGAVAKDVEDFNRAGINHALSPIGQSLSTDTKIGNDAIAEMAGRVGDAYKAAVPDAGGPIDQRILQDIGSLRVNARMQLPPDRAQQLENFIQSKVLDNIKNGNMSGQAFKDAESDIGKAASGYLRGNNTADERGLGDALRQLQGNIRDWVARVSPESAADIQAANQSYARMLRVQDAAARGQEGVFTPQNLLASVKKYGGPVQFARGGALMQDFAQNAALGQQQFAAASRQALQPPTGSGGHAGGIGAGIIGADMLEHVMQHPSPWMIAALATAYPALSGLYSNTGRRIVNNMIAGSGGVLGNLPVTPLASQFGARQGLFGQPPNQ